MPRIAIPMPHSIDREYAERAIPQYERAVEQAGGEAVRIALDQTKAQVNEIIAGCDGVLLPGSNADVDPARFGAQRSSHTAVADPRRDAVDILLLEDAYKRHKPVLGICYGLQSMNVFHGGSLVQHIPDFLPEELRARVDHEAGKVSVAHSVEIDAGSRLALVAANGGPQGAGSSRASIPTNDKAAIESPESHRPNKTGNQSLILPVNSSHHQAADKIGKGLRISARCAEDGIIEALEGAAPDHFVLAVQWHPERSVDNDEASRAIFRALVDTAGGTVSKIRPR